MNRAVLSADQQAILYALVSWMVQHGQLDLGKAAEAAGGETHALIKRGCNFTSQVLDAVDGSSVDLGVFAVLKTAARRLVTGSKLAAIAFMAQRFEVECSEAYFPGFTEPDVGDGAQDDGGNEAQAQVAIDLSLAFPDTSSRVALLAELDAWTKLDPDYASSPDSVPEKVRTAWGLEVLAPA